MNGLAKRLRLSWRPGGSGRADGEWWPGDVASGTTIDQVLWFSGASVSRCRAHLELAWVDPKWPAMSHSLCVRATVSAEALTIDIPPVWHLHIHLGWFGERLLVSSDLHVLADALSETRPSLAGVASFLVQGRWGRGLNPSLYENIWTLEPGYEINVRHNREIRCRRTWRPEADNRYNAATFANSTKGVRGSLLKIADRIFASHRRVGCLFSGGLDSSLVAAMLLRRDQNRVVLFHLGGAFGTTAEADLRMRLLSEFKAVSHAVDLPNDRRLLQSLRAANAVAPLPVGSIFSHVFDEIISVAKDYGCSAIVTGDGGDEVFAEQEEILVDLLLQCRRRLISAAAHFALRNGERITDTLRRAYVMCRALQRGFGILSDIGPERRLAGTKLAEEMAGVLAAADEHTRKLWANGWSLSDLGAWRRAANVPEWEPLCSSPVDFPVLSPLADQSVIESVLELRREEFFPAGAGVHTKALLRNAALAWLPADIAMHPKIGSADGELLRRMRSREHRALLDLLSSETARRAGIYLPSAAESPNSPLWRGDWWLRTAALVSWLECGPLPNAPRRTAPNVACVSVSQPIVAANSPAAALRPPTHVAIFAALNIAAQLVPDDAVRPKHRDLARIATREIAALRVTLTDMAERACKFPLVTGSSFAVHKALCWYLRLLGFPVELVAGVRLGQAERRYWLNVAGAIIDVNGSEIPLVGMDERGGERPLT